MRTTFKVEGFKEMDAALGEFSKATAKNVLRRAGLAALEPVAEEMRNRAPEAEGDLKEAIAVSTRLGKRQKRLNRNPSTVEVYAGPAGSAAKAAPPQGVQQEFGNESHGPQPFVRPTWDIKRQGVLDDVKASLADEIEKARQRAARKALKAKR